MVSFLYVCSVLSDCLQSHDCSPPGSSVHGIFYAGILEWLAISYSRVFPDPGIECTSVVSPVLTGIFFTTEHLGSPVTFIPTDNPETLICAFYKRNTHWTIIKANILT